MSTEVVVAKPKKIINAKVTEGMYIFKWQVFIIISVSVSERYVPSHIIGTYIEIYCR
jgi:hypothetical protein